MLSCLDQIRQVCLAVTTNTGHYEALDKSDKYCVWAEDSESDALNVDNYKGGQTIQGTIDYFTKDEDDENIEAFQVELNKARIGWSLNSVQYEDETGFIHYEWLWSVRQMYEGNDGDISNEGS